MLKISIIGAGNVGSTAAMRLLDSRLGKVVLVDIAQGLSQGKALDLEDTRAILKTDFEVKGSQDFAEIRDSEVVVVTAGLRRKPGMSREELLDKNSAIVKEICAQIKKFAPEAVVIIVTNPLDLMTYLAMKSAGFLKNKVLGMGPALDASRFANLISKELAVAVSEIEAVVIGSHGQGMLPLARFTKVKGRPLVELLGEKEIAGLAHNTINRGAEIVSLLGTSAYFAPAAAITSLVECVVKDQKQVLGVCAYLNGEYGLKDLCIGVPCRIGKNGIEEIIEMELDKIERRLFEDAAVKLREQYAGLGI